MQHPQEHRGSQIILGHVVDNVTEVDAEADHGRLMADRIGVQTTVVLAGIALAAVGGLLIMRPRWLAALDTHTHRGESMVDVLTAP